MSIKTPTQLSAEGEKDLSLRILAAERRALAAIAHLPCAQPPLTRKGKGSERTRAGMVDRIAQANALVWQASKADPSLLPAARAARAALAEAEAHRWTLAMSGAHIARLEARKLRGAAMEQSDLVQEGFLGLMKAAKRFDPSQEIRFSTYARWWVRAQMTRSVDMHSRTVRLPGGAVEQLRNMRKAMAEYDRAGAAWTIDELAAQANIEPDRAEFLLSRGSSVSLDEPVDDDRKARTVANFLADDAAVDPEDAVTRQQEVSWARRAVYEVLDERQRHIVVRRYGLESGEFESLARIAGGMSISRERVRQIEREALQLIRQSSEAAVSMAA